MLNSDGMKSLYSKNITRIVIGLDISLLVLTAYQVFTVLRANSVSTYELIFGFWAAGFIGAVIMTCALRYRIITFFATPFFLPALWFVAACLAAYVHHPALLDVWTPLFGLTILFLITYLGFLIMSVYMGVKRPSIEQDVKTELSDDDAAQES